MSERTISVKIDCEGKMCGPCDSSEWSWGIATCRMPGFSTTKLKTTTNWQESERSEECIKAEHKGEE